MAEPNSPTGEDPADGGRHAAAPDQTTSIEATEPTAERSDVARETIERNRAATIEPPPAFVPANEPVVEYTAVPAPPPSAEERFTPTPPAAPQPVIAPAAIDQPAPPHKQGNRLVGTLWVLLACGLYQLIFFAANALVALIFGGADAVLPQIQSVVEPKIAGTAIPFLPIVPVALFFLLFELVVLITNRAGRVLYVFASLLVGAAVYVLVVLLFSVLVRGSLGDANTLAQTFLNWEFILIGLVAREVMLWTGLAVGSRGIRVRRRNQEARRRYEEERAHATV